MFLSKCFFSNFYNLFACINGLISLAIFIQYCQSFIKTVIQALLLMQRDFLRTYSKLGCPDISVYFTLNNRADSRKSKIIRILVLLYTFLIGVNSEKH